MMTGMTINDNISLIYVIENELFKEIITRLAKIFCIKLIFNKLIIKVILN